MDILHRVIVSPTSLSLHEAFCKSFWQSNSFTIFSYSTHSILLLSPSSPWTISKHILVPVLCTHFLFFFRIFLLNCQEHGFCSKSSGCQLSFSITLTTLVNFSFWLPVRCSPAGWHCSYIHGTLPNSPRGKASSSGSQGPGGLPSSPPKPGPAHIPIILLAPATTTPCWSFNQTYFRLRIQQALSLLLTMLLFPISTPLTANALTSFMTTFNRQHRGLLHHSI